MHWRDDLVSFVIGCSFTFENALLRPAFRFGTSSRTGMCRCIARTLRAGRQGVFGALVVSMRPLTPEDAVKATRICSRFPRAHGAPVHFGDPAAIGIRDIAKPDFGDAVEIRPGGGASLLGLRRHAAGGGDAGKAAVRDHAQAGAYVFDGLAGCGSGWGVRKQEPRKDFTLRDFCVKEPAIPTLALDALPSAPAVLRPCSEWERVLSLG